MITARNTRRLSARLESDLDRREARALARAHWTPFAADPSVDLLVLREDGQIRPVPGDLVPYVLASLGLADLVPQIAEARRSLPAGAVAVLALLGGHARVSFVDTIALAKGGAS